MKMSITHALSGFCQTALSNTTLPPISENYHFGYRNLFSVTTTTG